MAGLKLLQRSRGNRPPPVSLTRVRGVAREGARALRKGAPRQGHASWWELALTGTEIYLTSTLVSRGLISRGLYNIVGTGMEAISIEVAGIGVLLYYHRCGCGTKRFSLTVVVAYPLAVTPCYTALQRARTRGAVRKISGLSLRLMNIVTLNRYSVTSPAIEPTCPAANY